MDRKNFNVELLFRQRVAYRIEAPDAETAERIAISRWQQFEESDLAGMDWADLLSSRAVEVGDATQEKQDDELILRFIREREQLLLRLGGQVFAASRNDSISAAQAATDLGWNRVDRTGVLHIDIMRAADALERLCERKLLICFTRDRVRAGERGVVRLYCTPEYLERLSVDLTAVSEEVEG